jgi:hypothetical protein
MIETYEVPQQVVSWRSKKLAAWIIAKNTKDIQEAVLQWQVYHFYQNKLREIGED